MQKIHKFPEIRGWEFLKVGGNKKIPEVRENVALGYM